MVSIWRRGEIYPTTITSRGIFAFGTAILEVFQEVKCMCDPVLCDNAMQSGEMVEGKTEENFRLNLDNGRIKYVKTKQSYPLQVQKDRSTRDEKTDGAIYVCPMSPPSGLVCV